MKKKIVFRLLILSLITQTSCGGCGDKIVVVKKVNSDVGRDARAETMEAGLPDRYVAPERPDASGRDATSFDQNSYDQGADLADNTGSDAAMVVTVDSGTPLDCVQTLECMLNRHCLPEDSACLDACYNQASPAAQQQAQDLINCALPNCRSLIEAPDVGDVLAWRRLLIMCVIAIGCDNQLNTCVNNSVLPTVDGGLAHD